MNSPRAPLFKKRVGIFNIKETLQKRKLLRKGQTEVEALLWKELRNRRLHNFKFFRQYGIGHFIADFYCPSLKLVIELDGWAHFSKDGIEYDNERAEYFRALGIRTARFSNSDVLTRIGVVLANIEEVCFGASLSLLKEGERGSL